MSFEFLACCFCAEKGCCEVDSQLYPGLRGVSFRLCSKISNVQLTWQCGAVRTLFVARGFSGSGGPNCQSTVQQACFVLLMRPKVFLEKEGME